MIVKCNDQNKDYTARLQERLPGDFVANHLRTELKH